MLRQNSSSLNWKPLLPAFLTALITWLFFPAPAAAYIGPGAGFALGGSFLFALIGILLAVGTLLLWPIRFLIRSLRGRRRRQRARTRRVVVLGLDGVDFGLARRWLEAGELPNFRKVQQRGGFAPLQTTLPAVSPVAWSGFATGADASRHNIFDFLTRDPNTYLPVLSSTRFTGAGKMLKLGKLVLRRAHQKIVSTRKSKTFWRILADHGVRSAVLRLPITFPPEKFRGLMLSAMCVPDLRGTQGTFSFYSTSRAPADEGGDPSEAGETTGGVRLTLRPDGKNGSRFTSHLVGPDRPGADGDDPLTLPLAVTVDADRSRARFKVDGQAFTLGPDQDSEWIRVCFRAGRVKAKGICKFRVTSWADPFSFYTTPIHIDPESPAMPISHPPHFAIALAKLHGPYATLGLAEDTWALNEGVIDEQAFLDQVWAIHAEREWQFFHALERQPDGVVASVFDATDRVQHMFFRYLDPDHPANRGRDTERHRNVILDLYRRADDLVGRTLDRLRPDDVLLIVSDHGFKTFQRGVNLNSWFREQGYLFLRSDPREGPLPALPAGSKFEPAEIDWSRTRAYSNGLAGFYLNVAGRERDGLVPWPEVPAVKEEILAKLRGLQDPERNEPVINELYDSSEAYRGPYRENAPDVIVGFRPGYRADWDAAVGRVTDQVIKDNDRPWSGDHCLDPQLVPGILFSSRPFTRQDPRLVDLAPSILDLFGVDRPAFMTGSTIFEESR